MVKKLSATLILSTALLFGGMAPTSVDAAFSLDNDQEQHERSSKNEQLNQNQNTYFDLLQQIEQTFKNKYWYESKPEPEQERESDHPVDQPEQEERESDQPVEQPEQPQQQTPTTPEEPQQDQNQEQTYELSQFDEQVVELTNNKREKEGLDPLQVDWELSRVAREKSNDMATNNYFDHNSPTYGSPFDMMESYGVNYRTAGENIAYGQRSPEEVVNAWMDSPGHRENIMNPEFTHIGVGYVESGNHWTQMFIGK